MTLSIGLRRSRNVIFYYGVNLSCWGRLSTAICFIILLKTLAVVILNTYMIFFFDSAKPRVTKKEFQKVRSALMSKGFNPQDITEAEEVFRADLDSDGSSGSGISEKEIDAGIVWLKNNIGKHRLSEQKIDILESVLRGKL